MLLRASTAMQQCCAHRDTPDGSLAVPFLRAAGGKLQRMTPQLLGDLLRSPELLPLRLIALRELLPGANVSSMVAQQPQLLMRPTDELAGAVQQLRELLKVDHIDT
jgi:hypothetical protein